MYIMRIVDAKKPEYALRIRSRAIKVPSSRDFSDDWAINSDLNNNSFYGLTHSALGL